MPRWLRYWIAFWLGVAFGAGLARGDERNFGQECLALAMYSEARSEGTAAMYEVGLVALRRSRDPQHRWPQDICSVIEEKEQFIGVSSWPFPRHPAEKEAWETALWIAEKIAAAGKDDGPCSGALYFNQSGAPGFVCRLGALYFYGDKK